MNELGFFAENRYS